MPPRIRHIAGAAVRRLPPAWVAPVLRRRHRPAAGEPFARFERSDGRTVELLSGYRAFGKGTWRGAWWAPRGLTELAARTTLPAAASALVAELRGARTLPAPLAEFGAALAAVAEERPELVERTGRVDERLGLEIVSPVRSDEQIAAWSRTYRALARDVRVALAGLGLELGGARVLDAGCGRGYTAYAMLGEGAAEVFGADLDVVGESGPDELARMRAELGGGRTAELVVADLAGLPFPDEYFDLVYSSTVVEHLVELERVFAELRRVMRPGGLAYHGIDPWFGRRGGHALCTLDAPWAHVRLDEEEFARYVRGFRPHEAEEAIAFHRLGFQRPRLTRTQTAAAARRAGYDVLVDARTPLPLADPHRGWYSREILDDCRRRFPAATPDDLLSLSTTLVLRRR